MKALSIMLVAALLTACGPKYLYKENGIPIASCADMDDPNAHLTQAQAHARALKCLDRNSELFVEIMRHEQKENRHLKESVPLEICVSSRGTAKASPFEKSKDGQPTRLEKLTKSFVEEMEFPESADDFCFKHVFNYFPD